MRGFRVVVVDATEYDLFAEAALRFSRENGGSMKDPVSGADVPFVDWRTPYDRTLVDLYARAEEHAASFV